LRNSPQDGIYAGWLAEKGASHEPRNYDSAFLGFSDKWAGKKPA
jgi:hypothetical protein